MVAMTSVATAVPATAGPGSAVPATCATDAPPVSEPRIANSMLATIAPTMAARTMTRCSSEIASARSARATVYAIEPPTNGVSTQRLAISVYFAHAGSPPMARPVPMTAPVTVNAVAIGYPVKIPVATSTAAMSKASVAAVDDSVTPPISSVPTASETFAPCNTAPEKPSKPTRKPARITEIAFAPTAGANGVEPLEPAPIAQAIKRLATAATAKAPSVAISTIYSLPIGCSYKCVPAVGWQV